MAFLALPPDIRNIIYDLVFKEASGLRLNFDSDKPPISKHRFALAQTCRQTRNESRDLTFWLNNFHFHIPVLQDLKILRLKQSPPTVKLPLRPRNHTPRKNLDLKPAGDVTALRRTAREFVTEAMRLPHVDEMIARLDRFLSKPDLLSKMRRVYIHLGSQTDNVFVARFVSAWTLMAPRLRLLLETDFRVSFRLRLSRRSVVDFEVGREGLDSVLVGMVHEHDWLGLLSGEFTLPELAAMNTVRTTVRETFVEKGVCVMAS